MQNGNHFEFSGYLLICTRFKKEDKYIMFSAL